MQRGKIDTMISRDGLSDFRTCQHFCSMRQQNARGRPARLGSARLRSAPPPGKPSSTQGQSTLGNLCRTLHVLTLVTGLFWGRLGFDAGYKTLGACRVGNRTRKSTVAQSIIANDDNYGAQLAA